MVQQHMADTLCRFFAVFSLLDCLQPQVCTHSLIRIHMKCVCVSCQLKMSFFQKDPISLRRTDVAFNSH